MKKSKLFTTSLAILLGTVVGVLTTPAYAVDGNPPGLFELDGDPQDDSGAPMPDDWNMLYALDPNFGGMPIAFTGILDDPAPVTIYWKGGSKDILDIPNWWFKDGSVPDKDDITNAYAAAYLIEDDVCLDGNDDSILCSDGSAVSGPVHFTDDLVIYFGLDRFDNNGDAFAGFWFLQDKVTLNNSSQFDGAHVAKTATDPGDLLVLVEYPQGANAMPTVKIYEWDPDLFGDPNLDENNKNLGPLEMIFRSEDALCDGTGDKLACAITNVTDVPAPDWDYTPKGGMLGDDLPFETFYEGGINVTRLLEGANICISTFLAETRSSRSETSQLKDFVIGSFALCSSEIRTEIHDSAASEPAADIQTTTVKIGTVIHDFAEVKVKGPGLTLDPTGTVNFYLYDNGTCDGTVVGSDLDVALAGGTPNDATATAESKDFSTSALGVGTFSFHADYVSDNPDFPSSELVDCEVITVDKYPSMIRTEIHDSADSEPASDIQGDTVFVGLTIHDHAFVAVKGTFPGAPTPGGSVTFNRYSTLNCTGSFSQSTVGLSGGKASTGDFTPAGDTELSYSVSYSGDANYEAATDVVCEKLDIDKYDSELRTEIHKGTDHTTDLQNGNLDIGDSYHDHAYWKEKDGNTGTPAPTGNVTFEIYPNLTCFGDPLLSFGGITWPQSIGLDSNDEAATQLFKPPAGALSIKASWAEDANYHGATAACEKLEVHKVNPTILTKVIVRDRAEVAGALADAPTGNVTIKTYRSNDCGVALADDPVSTVILPLPSSGVVEQSTAVEQTLEVSANVASYLATYEGDANYNARDHKCELVQFSVLP